MTIHNGAFQGIFERNQLWALPEVTDTYNESILQGHAYINFLKCGVLYADKINAVSPSYASELMTYLGGHGMAKNFQERSADIRGIVSTAATTPTGIPERSADRSTMISTASTTRRCANTPCRSGRVWRSTTHRCLAWSAA